MGSEGREEEDVPAWSFSYLFATGAKDAAQTRCAW